MHTLPQALLLIFQVVKSDTPSHSRPKPTSTTSAAAAAASSTDDTTTTAAAAAAESPLVTRFYNALYAKLGDADLRQAHQPALFLNLVYRALKADTVMDRVTACSKKLLQVLAEHLYFNHLRGLHFVCIYEVLAFAVAVCV
jgi:CBF/Mak21 family